MKTIFLSLIVVSFLCSCSSLADDNLTIDDVSADSSITRFVASHQKSTWEVITAFPGRAIYFPIKYALKGFNSTIGWIDDEKIVQKIDDFLNSDDGRRGIRPTYSDQEGAGIKFYSKGLHHTDVDRNILKVYLSGREYGRQRYKITLLDFHPFRNGIDASLALQYRKLPTELFFGIGSDSKQSQRSGVTHEQSSAKITLGVNPLESIRINAVAGYDFNYTCSGKENNTPPITDFYSPEELPGLKEQVEMTHGLVEILFDSKNRPGNPTRGFDALFSSGIYQQTNGSEYGYLRYSADIRKYISLFFDRVLVIRMAVERNDPLSGRNIPFYSLAELGRIETIRGFERGRYRDQDMSLATVEYRYPVWRNWDEHGVDFLLFADAGQVTSDIFSELDTDSFKTGLGFGIRMWSQEGLTFRIEAGRSDDGWRMYFALN